MPTKSRKRSKRLQTGIRRRPNGTIEAYIEIGGKARSKVFPENTKLPQVQLWRLQERERLGGRQQRRGKLQADMQRYLKMIRTQRTYTHTVQFLEKWCEWLGPERSRTTITTEELNEIIQQMGETEKLSPGSVYRYCGVLQRMWTALDGPGAPNPVRGTRKPQREPLQVRGLPPEEIKKLLDAMTPGDERTICEIIAWTGLTHEQIRQLRPEHILWERNRIQTVGRRKGHTVDARVIPMLERGMDALWEFDRKNLYGKVDNNKVWRQVKRAAKEIGRPHIRPYDLRHSFGTLMYETSGDLEGTAFLLNHSNTATTRRYALAAFDPVAVRTLEQADRRLDERLGPKAKIGRDTKRVWGTS